MRHLDESHGKSDKVHKCTLCNKFFKTKLSLCSHVSKSHKKRKTKMTDRTVCKNSKSAGASAKHKTMKKATKITLEKQRGASAVMSNCVTSHANDSALSVARGERNNLQLSCDVSIKQEAASDDDVDIAEETEFDDGNATWPCDHCSECFASNLDLKDHLKTHVSALVPGGSVTPSSCDAAAGDDTTISSLKRATRSSTSAVIASHDGGNLSKFLTNCGDITETSDVTKKQIDRLITGISVDDGNETDEYEYNDFESDVDNDVTSRDEAADGVKDTKDDVSIVDALAKVKIPETVDSVHSVSDENNEMNGASDINADDANTAFEDNALCATSMSTNAISQINGVDLLALFTDNGGNATGDAAIAEVRVKGDEVDQSMSAPPSASSSSKGRAKRTKAQLKSEDSDKKVLQVKIPGLSSTGKFRSDWCKLRFSTKYFLKKHEKTHLSNKRKLKCCVCRKRLKSKLLLDQHFLEHAGAEVCAEQKPRVAVSDANFDKKSSCTVQAMQSNAGTPAVALPPEVTLPLAPTSKLPVAARNNGDVQPRTGSRVDDPEEAFGTATTFKQTAVEAGSVLLKMGISEYGPFVCRHCNLRFTTKYFRKKHELSHNGGSSMFSCCICRMTFPSKYRLDKHFLEHTGSQTFKCTVCFEKLPSKYLLQKHLASSHGTGDACTFKCKYCLERFASTQLLLKHKLIHVNEAKMYKCKECGERFELQNSRDSHMAKHRRRSSKNRTTHRCRHCGERFVTKYLREKHESTAHSSGNGFPCKKCAEVFDTEVLLDKHVLSSHLQTSAKMYPCKICNQVFSLLRSRKEHIQQVHVTQTTAHSSGNGFPCKKCAEVFDTEVLLDKHVLSSHLQTSAKMYPCKICNQVFSLFRSRKEHIQQVHVTQDSIKRRERRILNLGTGRKTPYNYKCRLCGTSFQKYRMRSEHMVEAHGVVGVNIYRRHERIKCDTCGAFTSSRASAKIHQMIHTGEKPFVCPHCGRAFRIKYTRSLHIARVHADVEQTKIELLQCHQCGKTMRDRSAFARHVLRHSDHRPFVCAQCGKSYKLKEYLTYHERTHLVERKPRPAAPSSFQCDTCGAVKKTKQAYAKHLRTHESPKALVCPTCGKSFKSEARLTTHIHMHTEEKPFSCSECGKCFAVSARLTAHMRIHTGEKP